MSESGLQALETWQCKAVPPTRADCVTNPMPEIAGLHALLPRLIAYPTTVVTTTMLAKWKALLNRVPEMPVGACVGTGGGVTNTTVCLRPGRLLPGKTMNSENPELYAVHPFRQVGVNVRRDLGVTSFNARKNHGDTGWSEDLMDAALLGMPTEATRGVIARATVPPYTGYRWPGFQAGIGAGGPITDHGGVGAYPAAPPPSHLSPGCFVSWDKCWGCLALNRDSAHQRAL